MRGSDSGRVVLPGNLEGSIIWRRVAALDKDKQKMPPGNRRITREFYNSLRTWIQEGAKFDGESATVAMQSLVPTDEDMKAAMLAKLSPGEFNDFREKRIDELWERVSNDDRPRFVKTDEFFVYGDVPATRLQQVAEWADEHGRQCAEHGKCHHEADPASGQGGPDQGHRLAEGVRAGPRAAPAVREEPEPIP